MAKAKETRPCLGEQQMLSAVRYYFKMLFKRMPKKEAMRVTFDIFNTSRNAVTADILEYYQGLYENMYEKIDTAGALHTVKHLEDLLPPVGKVFVVAEPGKKTRYVKAQ